MSKKLSEEKLLIGVSKFHNSYLHKILNREFVTTTELHQASQVNSKGAACPPLVKIINLYCLIKMLILVYHKHSLLHIRPCVISSLFRLPWLPEMGAFTPNTTQNRFSTQCISIALADVHISTAYLHLAMHFPFVTLKA
jgi:hypothetical protein